jgi:type I restriction enzyme S subunit
MSIDLDLGVIPEGWSIRSLPEVCSMRSGGTPPKTAPSLWSGTMPWVSGKDLKAPRLYDSIDHITPEAAEDFSKVAPAGSVLVLVRGMGLANGFALSLIERPMAFNQDLKALTPKDGLSGAFLMHALTYGGSRMLRNVADAAHGTKRLSQDDLDNFRIPIPPLAEQRAIAEVLDQVLQAIDIERRSLSCSEDIKRTSLKELFSRGLRGEVQKDSDIGPVPESWEIARLGDLAKIGNGTTPNRTDPRYWGGTIPWVTSGRMYERRISGSDVLVTPTALAETSLPLLPPGTVLIAIVGEGKTLGHCAILDVQATTSRHVGFIQLRDGLLPEFLVGNLESRYQHLRQLASGNGSTRAALTGAILKGVLVPVPRIDEQHEIVRVLEAFDRKIALHQRKLAVLDELSRSLLHKLMTGEIRVSELPLSVLAASQKPEAAT